MATISYISSFVAWVLGIVVLIKLFKKEGVLKGILGLICMLYTFIWGWMHAKEENIKNIMWIWTGLVILAAIINGVVAANGGA